MPDSYGSQDSGWRPSANNPTIRAKRKNGTLQGWESTSKANEKKKPSAPKPMGTDAVWRGGRQVNPNYHPRHTQSPGTEGKRTTYRFKEFNRYNAKDQDPNKIKTKIKTKSSVLKDVQKLKSIKGAAQRRAYRTSRGLYLGKYYGPDQFKGDKKLNAAWEKSGKKGSASEFMKKRYNRNPDSDR